MPDRTRKPFIQLHNLTHVYREGGREREILKGIDGEIYQGESVGLLGRSGSGKSTLLNLIAGIDTPAGGEIVIVDQTITRLDERARTLFRRRHIGFVYQLFNLVPTLSVEENLLLPLQLNGHDMASAGRRAGQLLERIGLADRARSFPEQLSGGEQQRVAVARALVHEPALVLADEPTGNLDAENGRLVLDLLYDLASGEGRTLIVVTHSRAVAERADRILSLQQGRLVEADAEMLW